MVHLIGLQATQLWDFLLAPILIAYVCFKAFVRTKAKLRRYSSVGISLELSSGNSKEIQSLRHDVWATELNQYHTTATRTLPERSSRCIVAKDILTGDVLGYVAITPPHEEGSVDKYLGVAREENEWEIRALTVCQHARSKKIGSALAYAAFRYIEVSATGKEEGGVVVMARTSLISLYQKYNLQPLPLAPKMVGSLEYVAMHASLQDIKASLRGGNIDFNKFNIQWNLPYMFTSFTSGCHHGGAGLDTALPDPEAIHADVLDAWYPPAPEVVDVVRNNLILALGTTPPSDTSETQTIIATARQLRKDSILLGAGSSDLIYRAFFEWLSPSSKVLLLHPTYGEYDHLLALIGCQVTHFHLESDYSVNLPRLVEASEDHDMVIIVNPNSPTGLWADLTPDILQQFKSTRVWIDETYIDFVNPHVSVERYAETTANVVVCKSMSKVYGLSGTRIAYLCASPMHLEGLRAGTPPWILSRAAHLAVAAVFTTSAQNYYFMKIKETHLLRTYMVNHLEEHGFECVPAGVANFIMCAVPLPGTAEALVKKCAASKVFVRLNDNDTIRIAVKEKRIADTLLDSVCAAAALPGA